LVFFFFEKKISKKVLFPPFQAEKRAYLWDVARMDFEQPAPLRDGKSCKQTFLEDIGNETPE